jgi:(p)ppGpp synthase/HD superfamily hydrolase
VSAALEPLGLEQIKTMPVERVNETAARLWDQLRPAPPVVEAAPLQRAEKALAAFEKRKLALKFYLLGRNYYKALEAFNFAEQHHTGLRKDGVTPEFQHQIDIALYLTTLKDVQDEETTLAAALLHDVMEDYAVSHEEMERRFGLRLTEIVWRLTKKYKGVEKDLPAYFEEISNDPVASLVKGADRIHNVQSMVGVFTVEHQKHYVDEVKTYFLPMLKRAKKSFPRQSPAYFNIEHLLKSQLRFLEALFGESASAGDR